MFKAKAQGILVKSCRESLMRRHGQEYAALPPSIKTIFEDRARPLTEEKQQQLFPFAMQSPYSVLVHELEGAMHGSCRCPIPTISWSTIGRYLTYLRQIW